MSHLPKDGSASLDQRSLHLREELREAWMTNHRINLALLNAISDEGLSATLSTRGGRDVARQFAHLHNVRLAQMEKRARDLATDLEKFG